MLARYNLTDNNSLITLYLFLIQIKLQLECWILAKISELDTEFEYKSFHLFFVSDFTLLSIYYCN